MKEDASAQGWIIGNVQGAIPNPIPKKQLKKASAQQPLKKEDVTGFADASAPSNSNYQTELSPTQTAKKPGKKKMKNIKEYYHRNIVELAHVCPECDNTGVKKQFGNNMLCTCTHGEDRRVDQENLMFKQARDMLGTGHTTAVAESNAKVYDTPKRVVARRTSTTVGGEYKRVASGTKGTILTSGEGLGGKVHFIKWDGHKGTHAQRADDVKKLSEDIITSLDDVADILEAYEPSDKLKSRTKYLVHPKLSKTLRDRLAARGKPKKKGYTPSQGTAGLAAARRTQMSTAKTPSPKGYPEEVKSLAHREVADDKAHKKSPHTVKEELGIYYGSRVAKKGLLGTKYGTAHPFKDFHSEVHWDNGKKSIEHHSSLKALHSVDKGYWNNKPKKTVKETVGTGNFSTLPNQINDLKSAKSKKPNFSSRVVNKMLPGLSAKPQMGSSNDNRMSESIDESKIEKITAREILDKTGTRGVDFHTLRGDQVSDLLAHAKTHKYRKSASAPGSTARMFHSHLHRIIGEAVVDEAYNKDAVDKEIAKDKRIGKKEAKLIHALLRPRFTPDTSKANPPITKAEIMKRNGVKEETSNERPYVVVHAKKGRHETTASSSYEAAKKAATHWKLKNTAGISTHLADIKHIATEEVVNEGEPSYVKSNSQRIMHNMLKNKPAPKGTFADGAFGYGKKKEAPKTLKKEEAIVENQELKKFTGEGKGGLKRKYLGNVRGRTATGKPAHAIEIDPVINTRSDINKVVR